MSLVLEELISTYLDNDYGQSIDLLDKDLAERLKANLLHLIAQDKLSQAGIGQNQEFQVNQIYRKDKIFWLENPSDNEAERSFFELIDTLVIYLNRTCFTGINSYEFHYALYEPGSFYRKHIDQFSKNDSRIFSIIFYLNEDWTKGDGGELVLYIDDQLVKINPRNGQMIFFDSAKLYHEVLDTTKSRYSITGWLRRD